MKHVQIIDNDCIHKYAKSKYQNLYTEVMSQDKISSSSWYDLSDLAFSEYIEYFKEMKQLKIFKPKSEIKYC